MGRQLNFTKLNVDVLLLIIDHLDSEFPHSLPKLAQVSRFCKILVDPYLYRVIELRDDDKSSGVTRQKVERLLNNSDLIRQYVQRLEITTLREDSELLNPSILEQIISNLVNLRDFSWNVDTRIAKQVISRLETCRPDAKLHVKNYRSIHHGPDGDMNMDVRLLSSPLLYSLKYSVWYVSDNDMKGFSEMRKLKSILLKAERLRSLYIRLNNGTPNRGARQLVDIPRGPEDKYEINLDLQTSDRFPPLHELKIADSRPYCLSRHHCEIWRQSMDWRQLLRLDLGSGCPQDFFEQLRGSVPNLKWLRLGVRTGLRNHGWYTSESVTPVSEFLAFIHSLDHLFIENDANDNGGLFSTIVELSKSLQTLKFHTVPDQRHQRDAVPVWTSSQLQVIYDMGSSLSHLEIDIGLEQGKWPSETVTTISHFSRLRHLKIFIELHEAASDFSEVYKPCFGRWGDHVSPPPLDEELAMYVAIELFQAMYRIHKDASLRVLELCFVTLDIGDRGESEIVQHSIRVRRMERDDAPEPKNGGFEVESDGGWRLGPMEGTTVF